MNKDKYLNILEAANFLGMPKFTLRNWDMNGKFKASKRHPVSNYRMYKLSELIKLKELINGN